MTVGWTNEALENLWEIEKFIGRDSPEKAESFVNYLIEKGESIALNPHIGRMVPEISNPEIRELIVKKYRIVYRLHEQKVEILTVFEGHKLLQIDELEFEP
jgi:addiction module RelE/StbE family toxin